MLPALYLVVISALVAIIAYRTYGAFLAAKVMTLDDLRRTPAHTPEDGRDYVPTNPRRSVRPPFRRHRGRRAAHRTGCWPRSSATCPASCGCSSARCWRAACTTS